MSKRRPVTVETLKPPSQYTRGQIASAVALAAEIDRGKFLLTEPPRGC